MSSAIAIVPPFDCWGPIEQIRSKHDKAAKKWPPHMNLVFPFVDRGTFEKKRKELQKKLNSVPPIRIKLDRFKTMETKKKKAGKRFICLTSEGLERDLKLVTECVASVYPQCEIRVPHLTVGQLGEKDCEQTIKEWQKEWKPLEFTSTELTFLEKMTSGVYTPVFELALRGDPPAIDSKSFRS
ncbi:hypothetical protein AAMO2058_000506700 [Amorphochlora amoebiformis]|mmetsp:Transcript_18633/g.29686  ORF Transcript_18633/g.29686 Transcript_18633/m.29686 type:complete len:183 (-) Transcript_18633:75-623(-)